MNSLFFRKKSQKITKTLVNNITIDIAGTFLLRCVERVIGLFVTPRILDKLTKNVRYSAIRKVQKYGIKEASIRIIKTDIVAAFLYHCVEFFIGRCRNLYNLIRFRKNMPISFYLKYNIIFFNFIVV